MHIFVTGATGFIGSHFVHLALSKGHMVTALKHRPSVNPVISWAKNPRFLNASLVDLSANQLQGIDGIAHFAAVGVSPRTATWDELEQFNIRSTLRICQIAKEVNARLAIAGSFAEYGLSGNRYLFIPPTAPLEPTYPYAASKASASVLATAFARAEKLELAYLRIFNAYGEGQYSGNLWPSMRLAAYNGEDYSLTPGEQVRDFVDVDTVARCFLDSLTRIHLPAGEPMIANVGSGKPQAIRDFCSYWWDRWGASGSLKIGAIPYRDNEVMRFVPQLSPELDPE